MEKKFKQFLAQFNGQSVEVVDPTNKNQCFDLAVAWCMWLGLPRNIFSGLLNAYQIWTNPNALMKEKFDFIKNAPNAIPQVGDIVIFDKAHNHIVVATGEAVVENMNSDWFKGFSQNDPVGSVCVVNIYNFLHVSGWLRLKSPQSPLDPLPVDPLQECLKAHKQAVESADKKDQEIKDLKILVDTTLNTKNEEIVDLKEQIKNFKDADEQSKKQLSAQQDEIERLKREIGSLDKRVISQDKVIELAQNKLASLLAEKDLDCQKKIEDARIRMSADFESKEQQYRKTIEDLEKQVKENQTVIVKDPQPTDFLDWLSICFRIYPKKKK